MRYAPTTPQREGDTVARQVNLVDMSVSGFACTVFGAGVPLSGRGIPNYCKDHLQKLAESYRLRRLCRLLSYE